MTRVKKLQIEIGSPYPKLTPLQLITGEDKLRRDCERLGLVPDYNTLKHWLETPAQGRHHNNVFVMQINVVKKNYVVEPRQLICT